MANIGLEYGAFAARGRPRGPAAQVDFMRLVGRRAWGELPAAVRARFGHDAHRRRTAYEGTMAVRASPVGLIFAQLCRLIGTPLAPWTGEDVPTTVEVYMHPDGGLVWDRTYAFEGRRPVSVASRKVMDRYGRLLEVVRGGLGMALDVTVEDRALHFRSRYYFATVAGVQLRIPSLLTPGRAHVVHADEGEGRFRFTMRFIHPLLGETVFQDGVFRDPPQEPAP